MRKQLGAIAFECLLDLGVTVVYAVIVGFLIVGIVATDDAPISIVSASLYALILPGIALALIAVEVVLRLLKTWRTGRRSGLAMSFPASRWADPLPIGCPRAE